MKGWDRKHYKINNVKLTNKINIEKCARERKQDEKESVEQLSQEK